MLAGVVQPTSSPRSLVWADRRCIKGRQLLAVPSRARGHPRGSRQVTVAAAPSTPTPIKSKGTQTVIDKRTKSKGKQPPIYRVLLHNDNVNRRDYVVKVLMRVIDGYTMEDAVNVMQEAHMNGLALVTACAQETAEEYCEQLRGAGLIASLEPDGGGGGSS
ncbi:CLPS1 [Auxenochlorella protothecoides x Auxenochlorella symbiontica]